MSNFDVDGATILKIKHGSHAYGTNIPTSDLDIKGVCIEPIDQQIGFLHHFEQQERMAAKGHPHDQTIYSLKKFVQLAAECNPNIIEVLHGAEEDILEILPAGRALRERRDEFVTKQAKPKFAGYARAQLKRIKTHRAWLLSPPTKEPVRKDFGLGETTKVSKSELGAFDSLMREGVEVELPKDILALFLQERGYQAARRTWEQYLGWKTNRNEARAALEAVAGYDTKHGMHLMRLMRMCREILNGDGVVVKRPDAKELLEIRAGAWSYDRLLEESVRIEAECEVLYQTSKLPEEPDRAALNQMVVQLTREFEATPDRSADR